MVATQFMIPDANYWNNFVLQDTDIEFLYNHLLELETPQTPEEILVALVNERVRIEKENQIKQQKLQGDVYRPAEEYKVGQTILFPMIEGKKGKVTSVRDGNNPEVQPFKVIEVEFAKNDKKYFASGLQEHPLNTTPESLSETNEYLRTDFIVQKYKNSLMKCLTEAMESNPELVRIAGRWFPRALLVDVNIGYLNMAEALLDMESGGPLPTSSILQQIELPTDVNLKLTEFSLNLALQEDGRFDEVGPSGQVLWYLRRLEPEGVQNIPPFLKYTATTNTTAQVHEFLKSFPMEAQDELEPAPEDSCDSEEVVIGLIYPHWQSGTLPLTTATRSLFPHALESSRIRFAFVDAENGQSFPGWVVPKEKYVYGLKDWYKQQGTFPGSLVRIRKGKDSGEVVIGTDKRRASRDWVRTALVGADGGIVFALLKQVINTTYDERMAIAIPDPETLAKLWEPGHKPKQPLEEIAIKMMKEISKINPQGHINSVELYSAVNLIKRCPPGVIINLLMEKQWASHLGDLYFRLNDQSEI